MIRSVAVIVQQASMGKLLEPGDIVSIGTPAGVGYFHNPPRYLKPGDGAEVCVEAIGCIANPVTLDQ